MHIRHTTGIGVLTALLAAGCSEPPAPPAPAQRGVLDAQVQAIDKAKGVEKTLEDQAQARNKALEGAEAR